MRNADAPGRQPARQSDDRDASRRPDGGEVPAWPSRAEDRITHTNEERENELLCTICGLRACWQESDAGAKP